jgi:uncharacterized protein with HXXEE motif
MNLEVAARFVSTLTFREAVWLFPLAYTLHVSEEVWQFTNWARRYASPLFTFRDYLAIHLAGIVVSIIAAAALWFFPNKAVVFVFFTFIFTPAIFFNILFHAGATAAFGVYCPGLISALTLYPPLFYLVSRRASGEGFLSGNLSWLSFVIAGVFHAADVTHNVFKRW